MLCAFDIQGGFYYIWYYERLCIWDVSKLCNESVHCPVNLKDIIDVILKPF